MSGAGLFFSGGAAVIAAVIGALFANPVLGWDFFSFWLMLLAVPGHVGWLLWFGNVVHSTGLPHKLIKIFALSTLACIGGGAAAGLLWFLLRLTGHAGPLPRPLQI